MLLIPVRVISMPPGLSDFTKALIAAGLGLLAGIMIAPINAWISDKRKLSKARHDLYVDIGSLYAHVEQFKAVRDTFSPPTDKIVMEMFDYYLGEERLTFLRVDTQRGFRNIHREIMRINQQLEDSPSNAERHSAFFHILNAVDAQVALGTVDGQLVRKYAARAQKQRKRAVDNIKRLEGR